MTRTSVITVIVAILLATILRVLYVNCLKPNLSEKIVRVFMIVGFVIAAIIIIVLFTSVFFS